VGISIGRGLYKGFGGGNEGKLWGKNRKKPEKKKKHGKI
jgi:hypothetical protein